MPNYIKLFEWISNFFELLGVIVLLILAISFQLIFHELPCPLCLLQRIGFMFVAFGFLLNFRFGFRPSHYSIVLLSALFTAFVALRQIALHVIPGTGAYGSPVFGLHLYTWSFIVALIIIVFTAMSLGIDQQYRLAKYETKFRKRISLVLFALLILIIIANLGSIIMICGIGVCPDNPVQYQL